MCAVPVDVQQVAHAGVAVADVGDVFDVGPPDAERREENRGPRQTGSRRRAEGTVQRGVDCRFARERPPHDDGELGNAHDRDGEGEPAAGAVTSPCTPASTVMATSQYNATNGSSLIVTPRRKLTDASARAGARGAIAASAGTATRTTEMR